MVGATSGRQTGFVIEPAVSLTIRDLDPAILVDIQSARGDSGAAIVDDQNQIIGLLVGQMPMAGMDVRVFSPISAVLDVLGCDI
jgi:hypothetical protein